MRVDAHQHFWSLKRDDYFWLTPALAPLYRDFGPGDLQPLLEGAGISRTILVQAAPTVTETEYMLRLAAGTPSVLGVVGWVDFEKPQDLAELQRLAQNPLFVGVRPMIQDIPDDHWMLRPALGWAYEALIAHGLVFDALLHPRHLPNFLRLASRYPDLTIVVDHGAKPHIRDGAFHEWALNMRRVARETDAVCKLSGLVTEAGQNWQESQVRPYMDHILEVFGPRRVLFGSDWPVCLLASSYQRWVALVEAAVATFSPEDQARIWGLNALRVYGKRDSGLATPT
jgi:L-fuconolactonase